MQSVIYANISELDLLRLFDVGKGRLERWKKQGLPVETNGRFSLLKAMRWREGRHKIELAAKLRTDRLSRKELVMLLGVSWQSLTAWGRAGLKPGQNGYSLPVVLRWLWRHYQAVAKKEYERRLKAMRKKVTRNAAQLHKFLRGNKK
jgi:phage terminase Nu1 subunit (DNA packaging protein)